MSKASTRKRNKITLVLGAFTMITFGGVYGMIAHNAAAGQSAPVAATSDVQTTALVLTNAPTAVSTLAPTPAPVAAAAVAATPAPTAAPTPQPTAAPVHTNTRAS